VNCASKEGAEGVGARLQKCFRKLDEINSRSCSFLLLSIT